VTTLPSLTKESLTMPVLPDATLVPHDVPSPIDLREPGDAQAWARDASTKRPWRREYFLRFAAELKALGRPFPRVLELGSGPGELADTVLHEVPGLRLVALDFSDAMHDLARARLANKEGRMTFVTRNFLETGWADGLGRFDAVITNQTVHELRHKRRAAALYTQVRSLLLPDGVFLLCDHVAGDGGMRDTALYMTPDEQHEALGEAGWSSTQTLRHDHGLLLLKARP
jgi:SAM-dependent methyltransferase